MKKILLCIATAVLLMTLMANPVLAEEPDNTVNLPVSQTVKLEGEGAKAEDAEVQYVLTALEANAPMPEGTEDGTYTFSLTGEQEMTLPAMEFTGAGEWHYELRASSEKGSVRPEKVTITVYVLGEGGSLESFVIVTGEDGAKCELSFEVTVTAEEPEKPEPEKPEPEKPEPVTPVTPGGEEKPPKTGDTFPLGTYGAVALTSVILLVLLGGRRKKDEA